MTLDDLLARTRVEGECRVWADARYASGYGALSFRGRSWRAHRLAWTLFTGEPIPAGLLVRHLCNNPPCIRPEHLALGTQDENMRDSVRRRRLARQTSLPTGSVHTVSNSS